MGDNLRTVQIDFASFTQTAATILLSFIFLSVFFVYYTFYFVLYALSTIPFIMILWAASEFLEGKRPPEKMVTEFLKDAEQFAAEAGTVCGYGLWYITRIDEKNAFLITWRNMADLACHAKRIISKIMSFDFFLFVCVYITAFLTCLYMIHFCVQR